jgi:hypothetical protein
MADGDVREGRRFNDGLSSCFSEMQTLRCLESLLSTPLSVSEW